MVTSWWLYLLWSPTGKRHYSGISPDPDRRLREHNAGTGAKATRPEKWRPWVLVYRLEVGTYSEALRRERAMKRLSKAEKLNLHWSHHDRCKTSV
jgi:putative endonuclease